MMFVHFPNWYEILMWQCYSEKATYLFLNRVCVLKFQIDRSSLSLAFSFLKALFVSQCSNLASIKIFTASLSSTTYTFPSIIPVFTDSFFCFLVSLSCFEVSQR